MMAGHGRFVMSLITTFTWKGMSSRRWESVPKAKVEQPSLPNLALSNVWVLWVREFVVD